MRDADVVVESFRPGTLERLGLGWDALCATNPRVVLTSISNFGQTTLERTLVVGNMVTASGAAGSAQGGGIWNSNFGGPPSVLTLTDSVVTANTLSASPGITVQGGGLFTTFAVTLTRTVITGNKPDQCFGC